MTTKPFGHEMHPGPGGGHLTILPSNTPPRTETP